MVACRFNLAQCQCELGLLIMYMVGRLVLMYEVIFVINYYTVYCPMYIYTFLFYYITCASTSPCTYKTKRKDDTTLKNTNLNKNILIATIFSAIAFSRQVYFT